MGIEDGFEMLASSLSSIFYPPSSISRAPCNIAPMAQTKTEIQALLAGAGTEPRQRFGQNFMVDQNLVRLVAEAGRIGAGDLVIEVGPGTGTLTEEILSRGASVVAVEIDRDLAGVLRERFVGNDKFT